MKNFFRNIDWLIVLFALSINLLVMMIFYDVFRARDFYIDTKNWVGIVVDLAIIVYLVKIFKKKLFTEIKILTLLIATTFFALLLQKYILHVDYFNVNGKIFTNPLFKQFQKIEKQYDIDLSFTQKTWIDNVPIDYQHSGLFLEKPHSIDILFFGDSTIAWGFIPKIVEQKTGKKVGVYALESNFLTTKTTQLFKKIANYYLKENGIVVFCFDNWTKSQNTNSVGKAKKEFENMASWSDTKLQTYFKNYKYTLDSKLAESKTTFEVNGIDRDRRNIKPNDVYSFSGFQDFYNSLSDKLKKEYHLRLKTPHFYFDYLEPIFNPVLHKAKEQNQNRETLHIRWDYNTITQYNPNFEDYSVYSNGSSFKKLSNQEYYKNALAASKIKAAKKIYVVPLFTKESSYEESRNLYKNYYKSLGFEICDLGKIHPKNEHYDMQSRAHMGNTGGVMQSILMSHCLKNMFDNTTEFPDKNRSLN